MLQDVLLHIESGAKSRPMRKLKETIEDINTRSKLRISDKSLGGWGTVAEYESDIVASDPENERKSDQRALTNKHRRTSFTTVRPTTQLTGRPSIPKLSDIFQPGLRTLEEILQKEGTTISSKENIKS